MSQVGPATDTGVGVPTGRKHPEARKDPSVRGKKGKQAQSAGSSALTGSQAEPPAPGSGVSRRFATELGAMPETEARALLRGCSIEEDMPAVLADGRMYERLEEHLCRCPICLDSMAQDVALETLFREEFMRCHACRTPHHRRCVEQHAMASVERGRAVLACPLPECGSQWEAAVLDWALGETSDVRRRYDSAIAATQELQDAAGTADAVALSPRTVEALRRSGARPCPRCQAWIQKQPEGLLTGCDNMTCRCGCMFCFKCGLEARAGGVKRCRCVGTQHGFISQGEVLGNYSRGPSHGGRMGQDMDLTRRPKGPASKPTAARLKKELGAIAQDPPPFVNVCCRDSNILAWSFLIQGPPETPYEGGWYWGHLDVPKDYPFSPPLIRMATPNGRFQADSWLCQTLVDFHPEGWQPSWNISSLLVALLSLMCEDAYTPGAIHPPTTDESKRSLARESLEWNRRHADFCRAFPPVAGGGGPGPP